MPDNFQCYWSPSGLHFVISLADQKKQIESGSPIFGKKTLGRFFPDTADWKYGTSFYSYVPEASGLVSYSIGVIDSSGQMYPDATSLSHELNHGIHYDWITQLETTPFSTGDDASSLYYPKSELITLLDMFSYVTSNRLMRYVGTLLITRQFGTLNQLACTYRKNFTAGLKFSPYFHDTPVLGSYVITTPFNEFTSGIVQFSETTYNKLDRLLRERYGLHYDTAKLHVKNIFDRLYIITELEQKVLTSDEIDQIYSDWETGNKLIEALIIFEGDNPTPKNIEQFRKNYRNDIGPLIAYSKLKNI